MDSSSFLSKNIFLFRLSIHFVLLLKPHFLHPLFSSSPFFSVLLSGFPGCLGSGCFSRPQQHGRSLGGKRDYRLDPSPQDGRTGGPPSLFFRWARTLRAPKSTTPSWETTSQKVGQCSLGGDHRLNGLIGLSGRTWWHHFVVRFQILLLKLILKLLVDIYDVMFSRN